MSYETAHTVFHLTGSANEPVPDEHIWDWARRVTGDDSSMRSEEGMKLLWPHAELWSHNMGLIASESSHDPDNPGLLEHLFKDGDILTWGYTVFFTNDTVLTMFKLAYARHIKRCVTVERIITCGK